VAIRRPAVAGDAEPAPASAHPVRARWRALRIGDRLRSIRLIPILHPFPDIPVHVIESPGVWLALSHGMRLAITAQ
jgi:hypothetical protein